MPQWRAEQLLEEASGDPDAAWERTCRICGLSLDEEAAEEEQPGFMSNGTSLTTVSRFSILVYVNLVPLTHQVSAM